MEQKFHLAKDTRDIFIVLSHNRAELYTEIAYSTILFCSFIVARYMFFSQSGENN